MLKDDLGEFSRVCKKSQGECKKMKKFIFKNDNKTKNKTKTKKQNKTKNKTKTKKQKPKTNYRVISTIMASSIKSEEDELI